MRIIDLSYNRYEDLLYEGNVDDESYSEWFNHNVYDWLKVAKHQHNQDYIEVKTKKGNKIITYEEWFGDEE